jgi:CRP-like cAMP-binding protein
VFGELSVLLDEPHTADVRALEVSQFQRAPATKLEMREAQETTRKLGRETVTSEIAR